MNIKQWLIENWAQILAWILAALSYFFCILDMLKVKKTRTILNVQFKERNEKINFAHTSLEKHINEQIEEVNNLSKKMIEQANFLFETAKKLVQEERDLTEKKISEMEKRHQTEMQKYRQSLLEISHAEKTLVAKGVSEKIAQRFTEKEPSAELIAEGTEKNLEVKSYAVK